MEVLEARSQGGAGLFQSLGAAALELTPVAPAGYSRGNRQAEEAAATLGLVAMVIRWPERLELAVPA